MIAKREKVCYTIGSMESFESKKLALLRILQILSERSDGEHMLVYGEILSLLHAEYGLEIERKALARNLSLLKEAGFDIVTTQRGTYLAARMFDDAELRLLIDSVLSSSHIPPSQTKELIEKLCGLSNKYFRRHVRNIYTVSEWNKTENKAVFYNIDVIDEAIERKRKIKFDYNKYGADKKLHRSATHTVSPYQMIVHNQRYYLMAYHEKWQHVRYFRLDRITNIEITEGSLTPVRTVKGYESGIDYRRFSSSMPYMFSDEPQTVEFSAEGWALDQVIDWFGKEIVIERMGEKFLIRAEISPDAMEYWAMQYAGAVEVLSPASLRERIGENLRKAYEKYKGAADERTDTSSADA